MSRAARARQAMRGRGWVFWSGRALMAACVLGALTGGTCRTRGNGSYGYGSAAGGPSGEGQDAHQAHEVMPDRFTAMAVDLAGGPGGVVGGSAIVQISITRWSMPEERDRLVTALKVDGDKGLLTALQATPAVGTIRTPDSLSWDLHYAHNRLDPDGSRHIFLATDRRIKFWEEAYQARSLSYPFTLIELQVDKRGRGEGKLLLASRIVANPESRRVEIESFAAEPVMLQDVREGEAR